MLEFLFKKWIFYYKYISKEKFENFNILSNNLEIDINQYKILDKVVAKILDEPVSNIMEI